MVQRMLEMQMAMQVNNKKQVFERIDENRAVFVSMGVERIGLFGSFVRGENTNESDVDVLVEFKSGEKTFDNFMNLAFFLEDVFGRKVDLVTRESLSPFIGPKILAEVEYDVID